MWNLLLVGLGGFVGAIVRYGVSRFVQQAEWGGRGMLPYGTLVVNVAGCLVIGVLMQIASTKSGLSDSVRLFVVVGLLGSLTTFSTFGYETVELLRQGEGGRAFMNVLLNVVVGIGAVGLGWWIARALT